MSSFAHMPSIEKWDTDLPAQLALRKNYNLAVDFCRDLTSHKTVDGLGLIWYVTGAVIFQQRYGHAPEVIAHPGDFAGNQLQQRNQELVLDCFNAQQGGKAHAKRSIYESWPLHIKQMLRDQNDSLDYRPVSEHYEELFRSFPITSADIVRLKSAIQKPFQRSDNIEAFLKEQRNNLARLSENNHALNDELAVELIKSAFTSTQEDRQDFDHCFDKFILDNPLAADRTPVRFGAALATFVKNSLSHFMAKRSSNLAAQAAEEDNPPSHPSQSDVDHQASLASGRHGNQQSTVMKSNKKQHVKKQATTKLPEPGDPPFYCWSHPGAPHYSMDCTKIKTGHKRHSTLANRMGGPAP